MAMGFQSSSNLLMLCMVVMDCVCTFNVHKHGVVAMHVLHVHCVSALMSERYCPHVRCTSTLLVACHLTSFTGVQPASSLAGLCLLALA